MQTINTENKNKNFPNIGVYASVQYDLIPVDPSGQMEENVFHIFIFYLNIYEKKPNAWGGGIFIVYLGYKKNCNLFFNLILHDKMV